MAGEIYAKLGTPIVWTDTGGDEVLDLGSLAADAVRVGAYHDWGADPRPDEYIVTIDIDGWDTTPAVGHAVDVYLCESDDATTWTGPESPSDSADGAGSIDKLQNLMFVGSARVWSTGAGNNATSRRIIRSNARYFAPVVHNNTDDALLGTSDNHEITITPVYYQSQ